MVRLVAFGRSRLSPSLPLSTSRIVSAPTPITCSLSIYLYIMLLCVRSHAGIVPHGIDLGGLMSSELTEAVIDLREADALRITDELLESGADPLTVVAACKEAMDVIGQRFADGQAFIPELIMAGEIMQAISGKVKPHLASQAAEVKLGTVVLCTVKGDIHDIGKDIVATMLGIAGVDVAIPTVVQRVRELHPQILGLSGLLTIAFDSMKATVAAVIEAGVRDQVKIMVGGAPVNEDVCAYVGADGWGKDAVAAVQLAKTWVGGA